MTLDLDKDTTNIFIAAMPNPLSQQTIVKMIQENEKTLKSNLSLKWTHATDLHITLGYLRDIQMKDINPVIEKFELIRRYQPIEATVIEAKVYGTALSLTLEPQDLFKSIHEKLSESLLELFDHTYQFDQQNRFQAHITIGRVKTRSRKVPHDQKDLLAQWANEVFGGFRFEVLEGMMLHRAPSEENNYECLRRYLFSS